MTASQKIIEIARAEVGVTESPRNSNRGKRVDEYKATTWLDPRQAWPWCAAFVCWVMRKTGIKETATFKLPRTASAWDFINWSLAQDKTTRTLRNPKAKDIAAGDIIVFTFSHIGIAVSGCGEDGIFWTVEGNTNKAGSREGDGVYEKSRGIEQVKARIRINA
jgi:hypothetical protein